MSQPEPFRKPRAYANVASSEATFGLATQHNVQEPSPLGHHAVSGKSSSLTHQSAGGTEPGPSDERN